MFPRIEVTMFVNLREGSDLPVSPVILLPADRRLRTRRLVMMSPNLKMK